MVEKIRFWSHKILPLVYDDSLSYYEAVCKMVAKVNELIDVINDELREYIRERIDALFIDSTYDAQTETLTLVLRQED